MIVAALAGRGDWLVVVVGGSKDGKSRTLFEALRRCAVAGKVQLVAPVDGDALRSLLDPGQAMPTRAKCAVLWLDDLELFLSQGVTLRTLREWRSGGPGRIVAATYGGKGSELIAGTAIGGLTTIATDVLQHARQIPLHPTTTDELASLRGRLPEAEFDAVRRGWPRTWLPVRRCKPSSSPAGTSPGSVRARRVSPWCNRGRQGPLRAHRPDQ